MFTTYIIGLFVGMLMMALFDMIEGWHLVWKIIIGFGLSGLIGIFSEGVAIGIERGKNGRGSD